jgi:hypothetical protein
LHISSPHEGQTITGGELRITYTATGEVTANTHAHWQVDGGYAHHDTDFTGTYAIQLIDLAPSPHVLTGYISTGHHDKMINTEVSVNSATSRNNPVDNPFFFMHVNPCTLHEELANHLFIYLHACTFPLHAIANPSA